jgi:hypothetical protein
MLLERQVSERLFLALSRAENRAGGRNQQASATAIGGDYDGQQLE